MRRRQAHPAACPSGAGDLSADDRQLALEQLAAEYNAVVRKALPNATLRRVLGAAATASTYFVEARFPRLRDNDVQASHHPDSAVAGALEHPRAWANEFGEGLVRAPWLHAMRP